MAFIHKAIYWVLSNKLLTFLILTTFIFFVCTVTLGTQISYLNDEVQFYRSLNLTTRGEHVTTTKRHQVLTTSESTVPTTMTTETPHIEEEWRLPRDVYKVDAYDLTLKPDLETGLFSGTIRMYFSIDRLLDAVNCNVNGVKITGGGIGIANNGRADIQSFSVNNEIATMIFKNDLQLHPGKHELILDFTGNLTNRIVGFYRSSYTSEGKTRYIATSKLEPTYARQAFPCFDEPNYKAKYTVHLQIPKEDGYIALSNMDQNGEPEQIDSKHMMVHFNTSVPMSTYVSCFIVCDFNYTEDTIESIAPNTSIPLRVYATPAQINKTEYALRIAKNCTEYYEEYFNISYPLPKLDMIAIPDFVSGAMEHWGLVTYRETALLFDENSSNAANKQRVATVVAHELAHMWFGNLVTLDWWNDLWLNEGFATYMQFKSIDEILPDWGMADQFLIDQLHSVLDFDSTLATHPIVVNVNTPNQITEIFDSISYNKGASVLRMLENAIGDDKFQEGIQNYLKAHKFGNAVTKDLWVELQKTNPSFDVQQVMDTWTIQEGYPLIHMQKLSDTKYKLWQTRFLQEPESAESLPPSAKNYKWSIPIAYFCDNDTDTVNITWLNKDEESTILEVPTGTKWVKLNHRQVGYYRVNYNPDLWDNLTNDFELLSASDKTNLLEDAFSIAKAGIIHYKVPLVMTTKMNNENSYVVWTVGIRKFNQLKTLLKSDFEVHEAFQKYVLELLDNVYNTLGWDNKNKTDAEHQNRLLRSKILDAACAYGHQECKQITETKFKEWLNSSGTTPLDLDVKALVYEYGMEKISKEDWEKVFNIYLQENDASEKLKLLNGLASVKDRALLTLLLQRAKDETVVRSQDYFTCLQYISSNDYGTDLIWDYVREHWEELVDRFSLNDRYLGRLIPTITSNFVTQIKLEEINAFFQKYPDAGAGEIARKQALERVKSNINWIQKYQKDVAEWLMN